MLWIYYVPTWLLGILIVGGFLVVSTVGVLITRPLIRSITGEPPNEGVDVVVGSVTLFFGLILALIAVAVWEQYTNVENTVVQEATSVRALYRDVEAFPEPQRSQLTAKIRTYMEDVIQKEWPAERAGTIPTLGSTDLSSFEDGLTRFQPKTPAEQIMDQAAVQQFNKTDELRNMRLHGVTAGVSPELWWIILIGAGLTILTTFFLGIEAIGKQIVMSGLVAAMIGLIVLMTAIMDHPFLGSYSVGPEAFELMYGHITASNARIH